MFNKYDVIETVNMIEREHLDIRTITMGISLLPCIAGSADETAKRVYDRVCSQAEHLVEVAEALSMEYGIPIVNKRVPHLRAVRRAVGKDRPCARQGGRYPRHRLSRRLFGACTQGHGRL